MIHSMSLASNTKLSKVQPADVQPNAVDLRLAKVLKIENTLFTIDEQNNKIHRSTTELEPDENGFWTLPVGCYSVVMENEISVGDDESGWVITRSTLIRNGCYLTTGLYDSGYKGKMVACLHVDGGPLKIQKGTRIGQYLNFKSEALHTYNGSYGVNSEHDKKYS